LWILDAIKGIKELGTWFDCDINTPDGSQPRTGEKLGAKSMWDVRNKAGAQDCRPEMRIDKAVLFYSC